MRGNKHKADESSQKRHVSIAVSFLLILLHKRYDHSAFYWQNPYQLLLFLRHMEDRIELTSQYDLHDSPLPITASRPSLSRHNTRSDAVSSQFADEDQSDARLARKASPDTLERCLSVVTEDHDMQMLRKDYKDFKSQPSLAFFRETVSVSAFGSPSIHTAHYPPNEDVFPQMTFSDCIEDLALALNESVDADCVRTWYV